MRVSGAVDVRRVPPIRRNEARCLGTVEYERTIELLRGLGADEWRRPTDCSRWDVRAVAMHVLGAAEAQASPREMMHQFRLGLPLNRQIESHHWVDGVNEIQTRERSELSNEEIVRKLEDVAPSAVAGRRRVPPPIRWIPIPMGPPIGWKPLTYLLHMGFTRDVWMHRIDIARGAQRVIELTPDHDGRIVADLVAEWGRRHREPFRLVLHGAAGGTYVQGAGGEELRMDAVDFCRILSGRTAGDGVLRHKLPL